MYSAASASVPASATTETPSSPASCTADSSAAEEANVDMHSLSPRMILTKLMYIIWFVSFHVNHLPDVSEFPTINDKDLHLWKKKSKKDKRNKEHSVLRALCAKWVNIAIDFAIKMNKWAVRYVYACAHVHVCVILACL